MLSDPVPGLGFGQRLLGDSAALVIDAQAGIKPLTDSDPSPGLARPLGAGGNIDHMGAKADGVVVAHHPAIFETEDLLEPTFGRPGRPGGGGVLGRNRETAIVAGQVVPVDLAQPRLGCWRRPAAVRCSADPGRCHSRSTRPLAWGERARIS